MTIQTIRAALESHLAAITPVMPVAYENVTFNPVVGVAYMRANLLPNTPDNRVMGAVTYFERGLFQATICAPAGTGPGAADKQAQAVRSQFKRGVSLTSSGLTVNVTDTPKQSPGYVDGDRWCVPVSIAWQCQISI